MTTPSMLPDVGIELREGYAEVGDFQSAPAPASTSAEHSSTLRWSSSR